MELRIPIVVDDVDWKRDQTQTTRGVERYIFDNGGIDFEIDLAPENAAILLKAIEKRDAELARIQAEYVDTLTDFLVPARRTLGAPRKTIRGAKRAAPVIHKASPAVQVTPDPPAITSEAHGTMAAPIGYRALPDKAAKKACRGWAQYWASDADWTIGPVIATSIVDAWKEVNSPVENFAKFPPKGLPWAAPKSARKGAKPATLPFSESE